MATVADILNGVLESFHVEVRFGRHVIDDLASYKKEQQEQIIALIIARAKTGPLIRPNGIGEPLHGELHGFTKIKPKQLALRIVYRPVQGKASIIMEVIAIGPRDRENVYRLAAKRLVAFQTEMNVHQRQSKEDMTDNKG